MPHPLESVEGFGKRKDSVSFDPRHIIIENLFNPRSREDLRANVDGLKPQIVAAQGIIRALDIRKDGAKAYLVDGESRLTAVLELIAEGATYLDAVPVNLIRAADESQRIVHALMSNEGRPLSKWDKGAAFVRLSNAGKTAEQIAALCGLKLRYVVEAIELADTPQELRQEMTRGSVTEAKVLSEVRKVGPTEATRKIKAEVAESGGTVVARARKASQSIPDLRAAVRAILGDCDQQPDVQVYEIHRDLIVALRTAMNGPND